MPKPEEHMNLGAAFETAQVMGKFIGHVAGGLCNMERQDFNRFQDALPDSPCGPEACSFKAWLAYTNIVLTKLATLTANTLKALESPKE